MKTRSLNEDLRHIRKLAGLNESEIPFTDLSNEQKSVVDNLVKSLSYKKLNVEGVHSTIHGKIVQFSIGQNQHGNPRYGIEDINAIAGTPGIRWVEFGSQSFTVGL